jgi:hypothetical protein
MSNPVEVLNFRAVDLFDVSIQNTNQHGALIFSNGRNTVSVRVRIRLVDGQQKPIIFTAGSPTIEELHKAITLCNFDTGESLPENLWKVDKTTSDWNIPYSYYDVNRSLAHPLDDDDFKQGDYYDFVYLVACESFDRNPGINLAASVDITYQPDNTVAKVTTNVNTSNVGFYTTESSPVFNTMLSWIEITTQLPVYHLDDMILKAGPWYEKNGQGNGGHSVTFNQCRGCTYGLLCNHKTYDTNMFINSVYSTSPHEPVRFANWVKGQWLRDVFECSALFKDNIPITVTHHFFAGPNKNFYKYNWYIPWEINLEAHAVYFTDIQGMMSINNADAFTEENFYYTVKFMDYYGTSVEVTVRCRPGNDGNQNEIPHISSVAVSKAAFAG